MENQQKFEFSKEAFPPYVKELPEGHPVRTYFDENLFVREVLFDFCQTEPQSEFQKFFNIFNQLSEVEKRYARKENQLFPFLEKRGWHGPSQGMWAFHDAIRDIFRSIRKKLEDRNMENLLEERNLLASEMQRLMMIEEMRLFPNALDLLTEEDWKEMSAGDEEIGWMLKKKPTSMSSAEAVKENSAPAEKKATEAVILNDQRVRLEEGAMTPEQINLMLKFMPVDLTYVDENDRVVFYNRGEDRVFPRSAGIIGREVRFCHPPKSVGTVLRILEAFKNGSRNEAEFWIRFKGRVIHIRYFALRDKDGKYKGVMEMSQDITEIQKLEGEQRLLDWDEA